MEVHAGGVALHLGVQFAQLRGDGEHEFIGSNDLRIQFEGNSVFALKSVISSSNG